MTNNDIINFYDIKKVKDKTIFYDNPNFKECQIKHPFRALVSTQRGRKIKLFIEFNQQNVRDIRTYILSR